MVVISIHPDADRCIPHRCLVERTGHGWGREGAVGRPGSGSQSLSQGLVSVQTRYAWHPTGPGRPSSA